MVNLTDVKSMFEHNVESRILRSDLNVCNIDALSKRVEGWRLSGYSIVFTAGVFDIFTLNHLLALYHYRMLGGQKSKLIVSIDTDERVKASKSFVVDKGNTIKPILSWDARAYMVLKQSFDHKAQLVDLVVQHGSDTCNGIQCPHDDNVGIAEVIRPDLLIVTSTSGDTIAAIKQSLIIDDKTLFVIEEEKLAYNDKLLRKKISTSAIIERVKNGN